MCLDSEKLSLRCLSTAQGRLTWCQSEGQVMGLPGGKHLGNSSFLQKTEDRVLRPFSGKMCSLGRERLKFLKNSYIYIYIFFFNLYFILEHIGSDCKESAWSAANALQSLGWEDPLKKETATHFSILAREIPWTEEPGGLQSMGSQKSQMWLSN